MKKIQLIIFTLIFSSILFAQPLIHTKSGLIEGNNNGSILEFLGVPFAKPPVDSLRWKTPRDHDSWPDTLLTQSFRPGCIQKDFQQASASYTITGSEDCLYLNIWTPDSTASLPVMVFIHGGANQVLAEHKFIMERTYPNVEMWLLLQLITGSVLSVFLFIPVLKLKTTDIYPEIIL